MLKKATLELRLNRLPIEPFDKTWAYNGRDEQHENDS